MSRWPDTTLLERFTDKYKVDEAGCWRWTGAISPQLYARLLVNGRNTLAHRWAYEHFIGPIPDGLTLDHLCRVRDCVNPEHLEPVTLQVNISRRDTSNIGIQNRLKTHCRNGHAFDEANTFTYTDRSGTHRVCRTCRRIRMRKAA